RIAILPCSLDADVRAGVGIDGLSLSVYGHRYPRLRPRWIANLERKEYRLPGLENDPSQVFIREARFLSQGQALLFPGQFRRDEQIHVHRTIIVEIDRIGILRVVLHPRSYATPERVILGGIRLESARAKRDVVAHHSGCRILRGEDVVVQPPL